jgi:hypothetical protein
VSVAGTGPNDIWWFGTGKFTHWDGTQAQSMPASIPNPNGWTSISEIAQGDVWAAAGNTIFRWDGNAWSQGDLVPLDGGALSFTALWMASDTSGCVAGPSSLLSYDGEFWNGGPSNEPFDATIESFWAPSSSELRATELLAVGLAGLAMRPDSVGWNPDPTIPVADYYSVWGTSRSDVWAVGQTADHRSAVLVHWDGSSWLSTPIHLPAVQSAILSAVWAANPTDAWAVGSFQTAMGATCGLILHFDGTTWTQVPGPPAQTVWGSGPDDVWITEANDSQSVDRLQ